MIKILKIVKALYPIAEDIAEGIQKAKERRSEGGSKVTPRERRTIVYNALVDAVPAVVKVVETF